MGGERFSKICVFIRNFLRLFVGLFAHFYDNLKGPDFARGDDRKTYVKTTGFDVVGLV